MRLTPAVAVAMAIVLLAAGIGMAWYSEQSYKSQKINEVEVQARTLALTVGAALAFDDRRAAQEYVNALRPNPELEVAAVYDSGGTLVASYSGVPHLSPPPHAPPTGTRFEEDWLIAVAPVTAGNLTVGSVYLRSIVEPFASRLARYGGIALLIVMASLLLAVLGTSQAALARANRELERRAIDLAEANRSLQAQMEERAKAEDALRQAQKMESLGQLTGGIAHDFNNLLAVILSNLTLLRKQLAGGERAQQLLERAVQGAERGAALTQRLLAFARRQDLSPRDIDVPKLVAGTSEMMRRSLGPEVAIETRFPGALPPARVDPNQLELALVNLVVNARDAMPSGGTIVISARDASATGDDPSELKPGRYVVIAVTDTGVGMDDATLARATEPFFTTKGVGKGTGLGLSMVLGLAVQSGGTLRIASSVGRGTCAEVWLPAGERRAETGRDVRPAPLASTGRLTILVVDDDALVAMATADMLEDLGHTAVQTASGEQALRALNENDSIDAVITDQSMPRMTGIQLALQIRERWPHMPVLLATGHAELPERSRLDLPRLDKPFYQRDLAAALQSLLRGAR
jgi:signal transduction histidine kinase